MPENCGLDVSGYIGTVPWPHVGLGASHHVPWLYGDGSPAGRLDVENHVIGGDQAPTW